MSSYGVRFLDCGECALTVEFGNEISPEINSRIKSFTGAVELSCIKAIRDVIPTYRSVTIVYDPLVMSRDRLVKALEKKLGGASGEGKNKRIVNVIPVCYEGEFAPDIENVQKHSGLSRDEVVKIHSSTDYLIYMLGFLPGFPYLGGLDERLHTPRLEKPRTRIEPGAVGIGGSQTGIYPLASPGGWQLIGRTPVKPYDPSREKPIIYSAGEYIRFAPVSLHEFETISGDSDYTIERLTK